MLVTDHSNHRVQRFTANGQFVSQWGGFGAEPGQFQVVFGIAIDGAGRIHVADYDNHRIQIFDDQANPIGAHALGTRWPVGLAVAADGTSYITPDAESKVVVLSTSGAVIREWDVGGVSQGITVGPDGAIYVGNTSLNVLQAFSPTGTLLGVWGGLGSGLGQLKWPIGVAFGPNGLLYVVERGNDRVTAFVGSPTASTSSSWGRIKTLYR